MKTKIHEAFLLSVITLSSANGIPTKNINNKLIHGDHTKSSVRTLFNVVFNGKITKSKRSFDEEDLIATCKHRKGTERIMCVASYVRKQFPDTFKQGDTTKKYGKFKQLGSPSTRRIISQKDILTEQKQVAKDETATKLLDMKTAPGMTDPTGTTQATTETTCEQITEPLRKFGSSPSYAKEGESFESAAVLIVPGEKKKVTPIVQDVRTNAWRINDGVYKPITCRKEEFGFADDVDPSIVDIASDMLCLLCQNQGDGLCIVRWCFGV